MSDNALTYRFVIAGGGTGGHIFPALAIAEGLRELHKDVQIRFVGTKGGMEARVIPEHGEALETIWISGFARKRLLKNLLLPIKLLISLWQSRQFLRSFQPHVVVGTGGYVMGPVLYAAQHMGIPTVLQEQNSLPGVTTQRLAKRAVLICAGFPDVATRLSESRVEFTGNPVRTLNSANTGARDPEFDLDNRRRTLFAFGGSLGARSINQAIATALPEILQHYNLIWQTGKSGLPAHADANLIAQATASNQLRVLEFVGNMPAAYRVSSLAICRAGAMTLSELFLVGLPAILIPFPFAAEDHQSKNAERVAAAGGARIIADGEFSGDILLSVLNQVMNDASTLAQMSAGMKTLAKPDAARHIAERILEAARTR